jgi:dsRNA-specific ribonuclease
VTHVSVLGSVSYQRLEFLGDALLDLVVSLRTLSRGRGEG